MKRTQNTNGGLSKNESTITEVGNPNVMSITECDQQITDQSINKIEIVSIDANNLSKSRVI